MSLAKRLLPALQLTRMALVFTAIADALCGALLLWASTGPNAALRNPDLLDPRRLGALILVAVGLYGFGMSLNDIIDHRRDRQISPHRPLPSGRIGVFTAHTICTLLITASLAAGLYLTLQFSTDLTLPLVVGTALLIVFYDFAGKYLVAPGLLSLGLIRFFNAAIAAPTLPVLWQPLLLLNYVTILSAVAYQWEEKRPPLTKSHWRRVIGGLLLVDLLAVGLIAWRRIDQFDAAHIAAAMRLDWGLIPPIAAAIAFIIVAAAIRRRATTPRQAGQTLMLTGLLWLIIYDAAFAFGYVGWRAGGILLLLLPLAYWSVRLMRWWSKLVAVSHRPAFKRAS